MHTVIGYVTEKEKDEIHDLFEKKKALDSLLKIVSEDNQLYTEIEIDYEETMRAYNEWWEKIMHKYGWLDKKIRIDFSDCSIVEITD